MMDLQGRLSQVDQQIVGGGSEKIGVGRVHRHLHDDLLRREFLRLLLHRREVSSSRPLVLVPVDVLLLVDLDVDLIVVDLIRQPHFVVDQIDEEVVQGVTAPGLFRSTDQLPKIVLAQTFIQENQRFARATDVRERLADQHEAFVREIVIANQDLQKGSRDLQGQGALTETVDCLMLSDDNRRRSLGRDRGRSVGAGRSGRRTGFDRLLQHRFLAELSPIVAHRVDQTRNLNDRRSVKELPMLVDQLREIALLVDLLVEIREEILLRQTMEKEKQPFHR